MDAANRLRGETTSVERLAGGGDHRRRTDGSCGIAIMAKASVPGRTKTRLVPPLTFEQAAALNTAFLQDMAGNLLRREAKPRLPATSLSRRQAPRRFSTTPCRRTSA